MEVLYHGEYIELQTELEKGALELDMLTPTDELEDTIEFDINLEKTLELNIGDLSND